MKFSHQFVHNNSQLCMNEREQAENEKKPMRN